MTFLLRPPLSNKLDSFCNHLQQVEEVLVGLQFLSFDHVKAFNSHCVAPSQIQFTLLFHVLHLLVVGHHILYKKKKKEQLTSKLEKP